MHPSPGFFRLLTSLHVAPLSDACAWCAFDPAVPRVVVFDASPISHDSSACRNMSGVHVLLVVFRAVSVIDDGIENSLLGDGCLEAEAI